MVDGRIINITYNVINLKMLPYVLSCILGKCCVILSYNNDNKMRYVCSYICLRQYIVTFCEIIPRKQDNA